MQRITDPTVASTLPAASSTGSAGYFQDPAPGAGSPTIVTPDWANGVQEELIAVITAAGLTPSITDNAQLLAAVQGWAGKNIQAFTSSGTFTVPAGVTKIRATVKAGGGGGVGCYNSTGTSNASGAGGGEGGTAIGVYAVAPGQQISVTVGSGGAGGNGTGGTAGGASSLGTLASATGGLSGSLNTNSSPGGGGGSATGGDVNITGAIGSDGQNGGFIFGGHGGGTILGGGGRAGEHGGYPGTGYGTGGGGAYDAANANAPFTGGDGAPGIVIVEW